MSSAHRGAGWPCNAWALSDYDGLMLLRPVAAAALIVSLLSLVGLPPFAGFFGKFVLFVAAIDGGFTWLALIGIANSVLSLFFDARVIAPTVFGKPGKEAQVLDHLSGWVMAASAAILIVVMPFLGGLWNALPQNILP